MNRSDEIKDLATALAKAQGEMAGAKKDSQNPHFKSRYADLASIREACMSALTKHGIAVLQSPGLKSAGDGVWMVEVGTMLTHTSGQWMADVLAVPVTKVDAQGVGSAITYARRYALAAFTSVAPEDDDGNAAVGPAPVAVHAPKKPEGFDEWLIDLEAVAEDGTEALRAAWSQSPEEYRNHLTRTNKAKVAQLRTKANGRQAVTA